MEAVAVKPGVLHAENDVLIVKKRGVNVGTALSAKKMDCVCLVGWAQERFRNSGVLLTSGLGFKMPTDVKANVKHCSIAESCK